MRNEIWYSRVIIQSVSTKSFQPHSFCQNTLQKNRLCCLSHFVFFLTAWEGTRFNLLFWQTKVCQSLDTSQNYYIFKDREMTLATQHLSDQPSWKHWKYCYCSEIPAICPQCFIFFPKSHKSRLNTVIHDLFWEGQVVTHAKKVILFREKHKCT